MNPSLISSHFIFGANTNSLVSVRLERARFIVGITVRSILRTWRMSRHFIQNTNYKNLVFCEMSLPTA